MRTTGGPTDHGGTRGLATGGARGRVPHTVQGVFVLFVGLCVVSALCAHLFVSLNYVLFIMACWPVKIKK